MEPESNQVPRSWRGCGWFLKVVIGEEGDGGNEGYGNRGLHYKGRQCPKAFSMQISMLNEFSLIGNRGGVNQCRGVRISSCGLLERIACETALLFYDSAPTVRRDLT